MPRDTITLGLSGDVSLADFAKAINGLRTLVSELSAELAGGADIDWNVYALEAGSAFATFQGSTQGPDQRRVERIVSAYAEVGTALEAGQRVPYSPRIASAAQEITSILDGRIESIRFETEETEAIVTGDVGTPETQTRPDVFAYGAIEGRVQTLRRLTQISSCFIKVYCP